MYSLYVVYLEIQKLLFWEFVLLQHSKNSMFKHTSLC